MMTKLPFEKIVAEHGDTVLRVCRGVLGPHTDADDAWSETFIAALKAWPSLPADANVEAWLVTIAHRKAIDVLRRRARQAVPTDSVPETAVELDSQSTQVWSVVAALPDKQRQVIAYHYLGGLPYADIADILGGTAAAARRAAADGMRQLRTHFDDAGDPRKELSR